MRVAGCLKKWLLCRAPQAAKPGLRAPHRTDLADPGYSRCKPPNIRLSTRSRRAARPGRSLLSEHGSKAHAEGENSSKSDTSFSGDDRFKEHHRITEPAAARVQR